MTQVSRTFESQAHGETQEEIACPLCGGRDTSQVLEAHDLLFRRPGGYPLVQCGNCSLQYVNPRPTPQALGVHYPENYFGYSIHEDEPLLLRPFLRAFARAISLRRIRYLEKVRGKIETATEIVDVGCGANRLLQTIDEVRGCRGLGVDFKPEIVAYVRDELKLPIVEGTLETAAFEDGRFDVVLMMEYLEHEPDPRAVLQEARRVTRTGGELALELPLMAWPGRLFGPNWWNLDIPRHLIFFSPETLSKMLDECGYEMLSVKPFTLPLYVGMSILQVLGLRHWARHKDLYPLLSSILGLPFVPFQALIPEFMFVVARAR